MIAIGDGLRDGTIDAATSHSLGPTLNAVHDQAIVVLYLVTSVGGTILALLLYRSNLVPRWIAVLAPTSRSPAATARTTKVPPTRIRAAGGWKVNLSSLTCPPSRRCDS
jgi:hypothetical protein